MPPKQRDVSFVYDMLDSARSVRSMVGAAVFQEFVQDRKLYRAIEREIEIIGEAANRISIDLKKAHPEVPWEKIVGTRHRLAHEYDEIQLAIIYRIATVHMRDLIPQLEQILAAFPAQE
jgi:uncharacterized protein with HEPN domain